MKIGFISLPNQSDVFCFWRFDFASNASAPLLRPRPILKVLLTLN